MWTLIQDVPNKRNLNQTTMGLLLMQLINHADRLICESEEDEALMRVFRYIEENYRDGSLTELASLLHYDLAWLSRQIKRRTGKSYTEHLQEKRMSQATYLLKNTAMHVDRIAEAVGYSNLRYFHQLFRSATVSRRKNTGIPWGWPMGTRLMCPLVRNEGFPGKAGQEQEIGDHVPAFFAGERDLRFALHRIVAPPSTASPS